MAEDKEEIFTMCYQISKKMLCITFISEDMQEKKNKHHQPMYYKGHIGSTEIYRIKLILKITLSIMPRRILRYLGIPANRLVFTSTAIFSFKANGCKPFRQDEAEMLNWRSKYGSYI